MAVITAGAPVRPATSSARGIAGTSGGESGNPVIATSPLMASATVPNPGRCRYGPVWPNPEIRRTTRRGFRSIRLSGASPHRSSVPGRKFSTRTWACRPRRSWRGPGWSDPRAGRVWRACSQHRRPEDGVPRDPRRGRERAFGQILELGENLRGLPDQPLEIALGDAMPGGDLLPRPAGGPLADNGRPLHRPGRPPARRHKLPLDRIFGEARRVQPRIDGRDDAAQAEDRLADLMEGCTRRWFCPPPVR